MANVGDSRAIISKGGAAMQMTTDHEPSTERGTIENTGGFVSNMPGFNCDFFLLKVHYPDIYSSWGLKIKRKNNIVRT